MLPLFVTLSSDLDKRR